MSAGRNCRINIQELGAVLTGHNGKRCLDLTTGSIGFWDDVAGRDDAGEGRPAVRQGKRFIHIPALDEAKLEVKAWIDAIQGPFDRACLAAVSLGNNPRPPAVAAGVAAWVPARQPESARTLRAIRG
jgi:hypothetical protein